jgi:hypothetical protein
MKANEAPEKIYLTSNENGTHYYTESQPFERKYVEYTHTDAFIEKAMKFLYDYNRNMVKKHGSRAVLGCSEFTINVYDFRKYMEGK